MKQAKKLDINIEKNTKKQEVQDSIRRINLERELTDSAVIFTKICKSKIDCKCRNFKGKRIVTSKFTTDITLTTIFEIDSRLLVQKSN